MLRPLRSINAYESLELDGYVAIFDLPEGVKIVLYGNGAIVNPKNSTTDTFTALKQDLLKAIRTCEIVRISAYR